MTSKKILIDGMSCPHCVMTVKKALASLPLKSATVEIGEAEVEFDEKKVDLKKIIRTINQTGFTVTG